jgi:hypothetical protein
MIGMPPPTRDRFLCAIAERVSPDRVQAVFLFPPIRQGPVETCVAVLAVDPVHVEQPGEAAVVPSTVESEDGEHDAEVAVPSAEQEEHVHDPEEIVSDEEVPEAAAPESRTPVKPVVLTARYRHTLKGPDRGKWELEILEQADAPLITIETVVRGVQARLDDQQAEPERLGADELRAALVEGVWTTPVR